MPPLDDDYLDDEYGFDDDDEGNFGDDDDFEDDDGFGRAAAFGDDDDEDLRGGGYDDGEDDELSSLSEIDPTEWGGPELLNEANDDPSEWSATLDDGDDGGTNLMGEDLSDGELSEGEVGDDLEEDASQSLLQALGLGGADGGSGAGDLLSALLGGGGSDDADDFDDDDTDFEDEDEDSFPDDDPLTPEQQTELIVAASRRDHAAVTKILDSVPAEMRWGIPQNVIEGTDNPVAIITLIEAGLPDESDAEFMADLLEHATLYGRVEMVRELLARGADPLVEGSGETAFYTAAEHGATDLLGLFLEAGDPAPRELVAAIERAGEQGFRETVARLATVAPTRAVRNAERNLEETGPRRDAIGPASRRLVDQQLFETLQSSYDPALIRTLLAEGADPNAVGLESQRPLHEIVESDTSAEIARILLEAGADPNAAAFDGDTPLSAAILDEDADRTRVLLAHGADPNLINEEDGETPLEAAITYGLPGLISDLVKAGAETHGESVEELVARAEENESDMDDDLMSMGMEMLESFGKGKGGGNFGEMMEKMASGLSDQIQQMLGGMASTPQTVTLAPIPEDEFSEHIEEWDEFTEDWASLLRLGFESLGYFRTEELPIPLAAAVHPGLNLYAVICEHPLAGLWTDLVARTPDGVLITYTNQTMTDGVDPPNMPKIRDGEADPTELFERLTADHAGTPFEILTTDPGEFVRIFQDAYAEEMAWRAENG